MDDLGFIEAVDRFGEGVVVAVADAADRRLQTGLDQPFGVFDRHILGELNWSSQHLEAVALALNTRPRKTLGWRTPAEAFDEHVRLAHKTVATTG